MGVGLREIEAEEVRKIWLLQSSSESSTSDSEYEVSEKHKIQSYLRRKSKKFKRMKALERKKKKNAEEVEKNNVIEEITVQEEKMEQFACKQETIGDKAYKKISSDKKVKHKERNEHHKSKQNIEMSEDDGLKQ